MAVIKHFLEQPCTRGSYKSRTSATRRTVPRSYPRALGIGLHDTTVQHTTHVRAHLGAYATATPEIMRVRASYRARGPAADQAAPAPSPIGCVGDASSGRPLRGREAKRSTVPVLGAAAGTTASLASHSTAAAATAGQSHSTLKSPIGMLRTRVEVHVSARVRHRWRAWHGLGRHGCYQGG